MKIVFAHPSYEYGSYGYFRRLVSLSGFETCKVEEMDPDRDDTVYVTSPANRALAVKLEKWGVVRVRSKVVYWNLERPDVPTESIWNLPGNAVHAATESVLELPGVVAAWVSDRYQSTLDRLHQYVTLGSHPDLGSQPAEEMKYDLCHFMYIYGRRGVIGQLNGYLRVAPEGIASQDRSEVLRSSRAILSIHQTPAPVLEVLRSAWSAAWRLPLLCEWVADPWPLVEGVHFLSFKYDSMKRQLLDWFGNPGFTFKLREMGECRFDLLCRQHNFRSCVEDGIRNLLR